MPQPADPLAPSPDPADLRARMTAWRQAHPQATFADMEVEATRQLAALRAELIAVALAAGEPETAPVCPACGTATQRVGERTRTVTTSGAERVTVTGGRYRCPACGAELFPPR
jgi:YgiT-type zinc finger domain-containing protein